jgi:hypothetical protein
MLLLQLQRLQLLLPLRKLMQASLPTSALLLLLLPLTLRLLEPRLQGRQVPVQQPHPSK